MELIYIIIVATAAVRAFANYNNYPHSQILVFRNSKNIEKTLATVDD